MVGDEGLACQNVIEQLLDTPGLTREVWSVLLPFGFYSTSHLKSIRHNTFSDMNRGVDQAETSIMVKAIEEAQVLTVFVPNTRG